VSVVWRIELGSAFGSSAGAEVEFSVFKFLRSPLFLMPLLVGYRKVVHCRLPGGFFVAAFSRITFTALSHSASSPAGMSPYSAHHSANCW
jgi:hypothetical protein